jgi:hypothetical protein
LKGAPEEPWIFVPLSTYVRCRKAAFDVMKRNFYKAGLLGLVAWVLVGAEARAEMVHGAHLPDGAQKVGENRYRAKEDFDATIKHYKVVYPSNAYPRKMIVNQPGIKAIHISNPSGKGFLGLNIYQANDEVRIYIVPAGDVKPPKKKK